jgi:hypothetical protein
MGELRLGLELFDAVLLSGCGADQYCYATGMPGAFNVYRSIANEPYVAISGYVKFLRRKINRVGGRFVDLRIARSYHPREVPIPTELGRLGSQQRPRLVAYHPKI